MNLRGRELLHRAVGALFPRRNTPEKALPGPGFRIQTRPRKLENSSPLRRLPGAFNQAPETGNNIRPAGIAISLAVKWFGDLWTGIEAITAGIFPLLAAGAGIRPWSSGIITRLGKPKRFLGYATLAGMLGASEITQRAEGAPGYLNGSTLVSTTEKITGVSYSLNDNITWMNHSGELRQAKYSLISGSIPPDREFNSPNPGHLWQLLAEGDINGQRKFAMLNLNEGKVYLRNTSDGAVSNSWVYPEDFDNIRALAVYDNQVWIYNKSTPVRVGLYSPEGNHLDNILLNLDYFSQGSYGISKDDDKRMLMNQIGMGHFNVIWTSGTQQTKQDVHPYQIASSAGFPDMGYVPETNTILLAEFLGNVNYSLISFYEGPPPIPDPSPTPEPLESKIGIFRPNSGLWAVRGVTRAYFGGLNDTPVPADYTGDGTTNIGIFRPNSGLWAVRGVTRAYFGGLNDTPVPGDYNGNGTADIAIFRPNSGLWAVRGVTRVYFGTTGDIPVPGDYTGDGTAGLAVFRPSSGLWAVRGVTRVYFGTLNDIPVPRDYTGDGTRNIAVFRPASGLWAVREVSRVYFGGSDDQPVPGDYDGDGTEENGIFRETSGLWAIRGVTRSYFGTTGDIPIAR